ncbi:glycosyltransferase [Oxynema sp. CENA135]|uniref:glycosyltransferase n=1 Tax=Oxynema sp. CENA135 TaxID=984206 RepID=UPI00190CCA93|nr:glycosyltransferase [Oxynema sp. CENA135]MBK4728705.1 glycosyltransferase [Oxynema sp. CENA135]
MTISNPGDNQKATIVHVLNGLAFGGNENLCLQLLQHSPPNVNKILIYLDPQRQDMLQLFEQVPNLLILEQPYQRDQRVKFVWSLARTLKKLQPQAILIYPFGVHLFVSLAARLAQIPTIAVRAGNPVPDEPSMQSKWKILVILSRLLGTPIHPCSHAVQQTFRALTTLPRGSFPIPNGCDVSEIAARANISRENCPARSVQVIGMVARLNKIKDHETLIQAFALVHGKFPKTQLWLIGDGEEKEHLQNLTNHLNLQEAITFWGNRKDIPELLGQMDVYVFSTTQNEGFGIALAEAMAASLPIVATNVPACHEVLGDGEGGLLIPPKAPMELAEALEKLLCSPEERTYWRQRAYKYAVTHHGIQQCAKKWYKILLNEKI